MENQKTTPTSVEKLRADFTQLADTIGLDGDTRQACLTFLMEKTRDAWISGKEFGWKKAWAWKKQPARAPAPAA